MNDLPPQVEAFLGNHPDWLEDVDLLVAPPDLEEVLQDYPEAAGSDAVLPRMTSYKLPRHVLYFRLRRRGQGHRLAEMVACQAGPALMTDSVFFQGMPRLAEQFRDEKQMQQVISIAQQHGYTPNPTDVYQSGLARFQGDPEAFVSATDGRGYIRRLCERRGWSCEGAVEVAGRAPESDPWENSVPLAEDLVQARLRKAARQNPTVNRQELRQQIIEKHGRK